MVHFQHNVIKIRQTVLHIFAIKVLLHGILFFKPAPRRIYLTEIFDNKLIGGNTILSILVAQFKPNSRILQNYLLHRMPLPFE